MDAEGLWKFIVEHRKDITALRAELPSALESAIDPARLVLQAIEEDEDSFSILCMHLHLQTAEICRALLLLLLLAEHTMRLTYIHSLSNLCDSPPIWRRLWQRTGSLSITTGNTYKAPESRRSCTGSALTLHRRPWKTSRHS